jgi:DNA topoisomerase I
LVAELLPYKNQIDPKYHFLLSAPVTDPEGNKAIVRFSRKTKEQYVQTEVNGKATGWKAFYDGGKWKVSSK